MEFLRSHGGNEAKVDSIEDSRLTEYMMKHHPRWYEIVEKYGSPIDIINYQKEEVVSNIKSTSVSVFLVSKLASCEGKVLKKKLLPSMTIDKLKSLCCKLFKADMLSISLTFKDEAQETFYEMDDNLRQLSFYSI
mmetsp:Transcript_34328/g.39669  ORF Transcript_34328/g.39669 Transcript_34328/m.39669 type:complete len:135 (-) Transcript_34328:9-413(-)